MAVAIVQIPETLTRLLKPKEAAAYCRFANFKKFEATCPVKSLDMGNGAKLYDIRDIDDWIDSLKGQVSASADDDIILKLGT